jgi:hypothetical protein
MAIGEERADGMWNGVVHVQHIELGFFGHFKHFSRQRQRIRRVIEKRIRRDFHFMKENIFGSLVQADGHGVTDEVDFVASGREFDAEFCGHHARAAVGWVTGNADFHAGLVHGLTRELGGLYFAPMRRREPSAVHFGLDRVARSLASGEAAMLDLRVFRAHY